MRDKSAATIALRKGDALVVVDVQRDFLPHGRLPVARGDEVVEPLNRYLKLFEQKGLPVYATRDWHPANHCSFRTRGGRWPVHCVAHSPGAEFAAGLQLTPNTLVVSKAIEQNREAYSGFETSGTGLAAALREREVTRLFVGGLATDYCVYHTVMDALSLGFQVCLLEDAIRAVEVNTGDGAAATRDMRERGALVVTLEQIADA